MKYIIIGVIIIIFILFNINNTIEPFDVDIEKPVEVDIEKTVDVDLEEPSLKPSIEITGTSLCSVYASQPTILNDKCGTLTEKNCNSTSCCGWLNGSSCVAGNANGPTFRTNKGKDIVVDSYSYMGTMTGKKK